MIDSNVIYVDFRHRQDIRDALLPLVVWSVAGAAMAYFIADFWGLIRK